MSNKDQYQEVFKEFLLESPQAIDYCRSRGLSKKQVEQNIIGFCPAYYTYKFPLLQGRITVAIRDAHGIIIGFAGRKAEWTKPFLENHYIKTMGTEFGHKNIKKWDNAKWINESFAKGEILFHLDQAIPHIRKKGYAIIVEGYFDALVLSSKGIKNVVCTCGVAFTNYHIALLRRYTTNIVLFFDADKAGHIANEKAINALDSVNMKSHSVILPEGYDPDELVLKYSAKKIQKAMDNMVINDRRVLNIKVGT